MTSTPFDYTVQPYQGTDIVALVLLITALICLLMWRRDKEPGMGWFALSMGALAVWTGFNRQHLPSGPQLDPSPWFYLMCLAMGAMAPALVHHLNVPRSWRRRAMACILLPSAAFAGIVALVDFTGVTVLRVWIHLLTAAAFATMGALAWWAARREPGAGHGWLALALFSVPGLAVVLVLSRVDPVAMRYWAVLPAMLVGLTLPSVALLRRRRALEIEVTRRTQAEQALSALNKSLEDKVVERTADLQSMVTGLQSFNRSVSHDLRGPLGGIASLAQLADEALQQGDASVARRTLPAIAQQAEASTRLVAALLELARVGDVPLKRQQVDPQQIAREVIEQLKLSAARPLPQFVLPSMPTVNADPDLLRAVLANLIGNAVKFTGEREDGRVEIGATPMDGSVCLQVRDNGVGFDAQEAAAVFVPFRRLHGGRFEGHGVGLSIVRRAVERHGGKVWVDASPGQGACFNFTLPGVA